MPRGFQRAIADTEAAYASGKLIDLKRRSFISQPKAIPGECDTPQPHLILCGPDVTRARMDLFKRAKNRCERCKRPVTWIDGEMHHRRHKPWNRCWCPANQELVCQVCHSEEHASRAPRFEPQKTLDAGARNE